MSRWWTLSYAALLATAILFLSAAKADAKRVALIVGVSDYTFSPKLPNAGNDARSIAASLERMGFEVITSLDADLTSFTAALETFYVQAKGAEAAIFYFAGHGLQVRGTNYLVPKDAQLRSETRLLQETVSLQQIIETMEERAKIALTFLDACRDNPLAEELQRSILGKDRSAAVPRGLAPIRIKNPDTLVVFAAAPGKTAADGTGRNSPFTTAMLRHMEAPGEDVELVMRRVSREVYEGTQGEQVPERLSRLTSDFSLNPIRVSGWAIRKCGSPHLQHRPTQLRQVLGASETTRLSAVCLGIDNVDQNQYRRRGHRRPMPRACGSRPCPAATGENCPFSFNGLWRRIEAH